MSTLSADDQRALDTLRSAVTEALWSASAAGRPHDDADLIDRAHPEMNDFALAEEVTLKGGHPR